MKHLVVACTLFLSIIPISNEHKETPNLDREVEDIYPTCGCPVETPPSPKQLLSEDPRGYKFSWLSDVDQEPNSTGWCYYRGFKNLHTQNSVTVDFKEAGMLAVDVAPNKVYEVTARGLPSYQEPIRQFKLYYAASSDTYVMVGLFKPQEQKNAALDMRSIIEGGIATASPKTHVDTSRLISSEIHGDLRDRQRNKDYTISLSFSSRVEHLQKEFRYKLSMINNGNVPVRVDWEAISLTDDPAFAQAIKQTLSQGSLPNQPGIELKQGVTLEITPISSKSPQVRMGIVSIYKSGTLVAKAFAPAYTPRIRT